MNCFVCRDNGMPGGCPECGKTRTFSGKPAVNVTPTELAKYEIPRYYQEVVFDSEILQTAYPELTTHRQFKAYCDQLEKIHNIFKAGQIPSQSALIIAPPKRGKQIFAFSCMQHALANGYSIVPMLDTSEWRRLNLLSSERALSKEIKSLAYSVDDIVSADVVFLTIDKDNFQGAYRAIESLVDKRARRDKPTFIISRYTVEQLSLLDFEGEFAENFDKTRMLNRLKYMALIMGK